MAWIQPNSKVYLLSNIPLDSDYTNTFYFETRGVTPAAGKQTQYNKFMTFLKPTYGTYTEQYYQRINKDTLRLAVLADNIYDVNYMMFQNTSFGNKWFYAFVKEINYVNNNATEIVYELDVMQTWYFDYELGDCFVIREHTATDHWAANLVPENLELGEQVSQGTVNTGSSAGYDLVIAYLPNQTQMQGAFIASNAGGVIQGEIGNPGKTWGLAYSPLQVVVVELPTTPIQMHNVIKWLTDNLCEIVCMTVVPRQMWRACTPEFEVGGSYGNYITMSVTGTSSSVVRATRFTAFGATKNQTAYTPKNNKLYTYPYTYLLVTNNKGSSSTYRYEGFREMGSAGYASFVLKSVAQPCGFEQALMPYAYNGGDTNTMSFENACVLTEFPQLSWSVSAYQDFMRRNGNALGLSFASSMISDAIMIGVGGMAENPAYMLRGAGNTVSDVYGLLSTISKLKNAPSEISGQSATTLLQISSARVGFTIHSMGLKPEMAKIIDNYFNMFGYAVNELKIPNVRDPQGTPRPHWNYVKTGTCVIHPYVGTGLPADAEKKISEIYNKGITFWTSPMGRVEVGDYSLDNKPSGWVAWG